MNHKSIKIQYNNNELILRIGDLLSSPVDVIVNPANGGLSHGGGLAEQILREAGNDLEIESAELIKQQGQLDSGMAVFTTAGRLPYKAVIHAVGPRMGEGQEIEKISQAVLCSLNLCQENNWHSIAFPAISTGIFSVPVESCARGFYQAITSYWKIEGDKSPQQIYIYLSESNLLVFSSIFKGDEKQEEDSVIEADKIIDVGNVNLSEEDIAALDNDDMKDWFT